MGSVVRNERKKLLQKALQGMLMKTRHCCRMSSRRAQTDGCPQKGSVHEPNDMMENPNSLNPVRDASHILSQSR
jgi:hypothetical protein